MCFETTQEDFLDITVGDEIVCTVGVDNFLDDEGNSAAVDDLFQDEFGVRPNHEEDYDALFEIVAVPDDVSEAAPVPGGMAVLICTGGRRA